jgi:hypothetical protein
MLPTFLHLDLQGQHTLVDLPMDHFDAYMQHYERCKRKDPLHTSACFLVPTTKGPWNKYRPSLKQLKVYPKGALLYMDPRTKELIPSPMAMIALYDGPAPLFQLHAFADDTQPLHMTFPSHLAGKHVDVLVDTGASHSFLDVAFAKTHGFHVSPDSGSVNCGGKTVVAVSGSATLLLAIHPGYRQRVKFYITKLPVGYPVILGNSWLIANKVVLDHDNRTMAATVAGRTYTFLCPEVSSSIEGGDSPQINQSHISVMQARRLIQDGCPAYLISVKTAGDQNSSKPPLSEEAQKLLDEYQSVFRNLPPGLPPHRGAPLHINTGDSQPVYSRG